MWHSRGCKFAKASLQESLVPYSETTGINNRKVVVDFCMASIPE